MPTDSTRISYMVDFDLTTNDIDSSRTGEIAYEGIGFDNFDIDRIVKDYGRTAYRLLLVQEK